MYVSHQPIIHHMHISVQLCVILIRSIVNLLALHYSPPLILTPINTDPHSQLYGICVSLLLREARARRRTGTAGGDTHPSGEPFIMDDVSAKLFRP